MLYQIFTQILNMSITASVVIVTVLLIRDMEMSCDEYVLQNTNFDIRINYSKSLLGFAANQRDMTAGLLPFGETDTRKRVKKILTYKKYRKWIGVFAAILVIATGAICLTDRTVEKPSAKSQNKKQDSKEKTEKNTASKTEKQDIVLAKGTACEYQVQIVYLPDKRTAIKEKPRTDMGMYEGKFAIQTYKNKTIYAQYILHLADKMYFPADGFDLVIKDYDGDGNKNDFSLGQGQTPQPMLGNYMNYYFFTVRKDGSIVQRTLSTKNRKSLFTIPDNFSKDFSCKDGVITYPALEKDGVKSCRCSLDD